MKTEFKIVEIVKIPFHFFSDQVIVQQNVSSMDKKESTIFKKYELRAKPDKTLGLYTLINKIRIMNHTSYNHIVVNFC